MTPASVGVLHSQWRWFKALHRWNSSVALATIRPNRRGRRRQKTVGLLGGPVELAACWWFSFLNHWFVSLDKAGLLHPYSCIYDGGTFGCGWSIRKHQTPKKHVNLRIFFLFVGGKKPPTDSCSYCIAGLENPTFICWWEFERKDMVLFWNHVYTVCVRLPGE